MEKLVKDGVIKRIISKWEPDKYRQVFWQEKLDFMLLKLIEESQEFQKDKNIEEFADVLEVIDEMDLESQINKHLKHHPNPKISQTHWLRINTYLFI